MISANAKILILGSAIALLAAGWGSSQPQANTQSNTAPPVTIQNQPSVPGNSGSAMPGTRGNASSTRGGFGMPNLPAGSKPFFGTVAAVSGSQITINGRTRNSSSTVSTIINITSATQFNDGEQSDLVWNPRAGYGTASSNGSIDAESLRIGSPSGQGGGRYQGGSAPQQ